MPTADWRARRAGPPRAPQGARIREVDQRGAPARLAGCGEPRPKARRGCGPDPGTWLLSPTGRKAAVRAPDPRRSADLTPTVGAAGTRTPKLPYFQGLTRSGGAHTLGRP